MSDYVPNHELPIELRQQRECALALEHTLELLGLDIAIPSTKASPLEQRMFEARIMEALVARVVALEVLAKRDEGLADVLASVIRREEASEENIDNLGEALMVLLNRESRKHEAEAEEQDAWRSPLPDRGEALTRPWRMPGL